MVDQVEFLKQLLNFVDFLSTLKLPQSVSDCYNINQGHSKSLKNQGVCVKGKDEGGLGEAGKGDAGQEDGEGEAVDGEDEEDVSK